MEEDAAWFMGGLGSVGTELLTNLNEGCALSEGGRKVMTVDLLKHVEKKKKVR